MTDLQNLGFAGLPTKKDILRKRIQDGEIQMPVLTGDRRNLSAVLNPPHRSPPPWRDGNRIHCGMIRKKT